MPKRTPAPAKDNWKLFPKRIFVGALIVDVLLLIAYALTAGLPKTPSAKPLTFLFGLNGEGNIPAWYSGTQLLLIGIMCLALASWVFANDERVAAVKRLFFVAGLAFVYLSADEVGQVHENMSAFAQSWHPLYLFEIRLLAAIGSKRHKIKGGSIWIPLFAIVGIVLLVWLWPQIKKALKTWRKEIIILAAGFGVLVLGATVVETIGNYLPQGSFARLLEVGVEETFEMIGASIILYAVARVFAEACSRVLPQSPAEQPAEQSAEQPEASPAE